MESEVVCLDPLVLRLRLVPFIIRAPARTTPVLPYTFLR